MILTKKLNNGLKVSIQRRPHNRKAIIAIMFKVGSIFENDKNHGISHFIEHLCFTGTKNRDEDTIWQCLEGFGGTINAYTSKECTCLYISILPQHLSKGLELLSDLVNNSTFNEKMIEREKQVVVQEIKRELGNSNKVLHQKLLNTLFDKHPMGRSILGTEKTIEQMGRNEIKDYYNKYYVPNNMSITVISPNKEENVLQEIKKYFNNAKTGLINELKDSELKIKPKRKEIPSNGMQSKILVSLLAPNSNSEDFAAFYLLWHLLGGMSSSLLKDIIRRKHGLTYSISTDYFAYFTNSYATITTATNPAEFDKTLALIDQILDILQKNVFSQNKFNSAKVDIIGKFISGYEDSLEFAKEVCYSVLYDNYAYYKFPTQILEQSKEKILEVAKKYLEKLIIIYTKPTKKAATYPPGRTAPPLSEENDNQGIGFYKQRFYAPSTQRFWKPLSKRHDLKKEFIDFYNATRIKDVNKIIEERNEDINEIPNIEILDYPSAFIPIPP